jgi:uncharacterized membrane protein (UPF0127 family)
MGKFLTLLLLACLYSCQSESHKPLPEAIRDMELRTPSGETIKTHLVFTLVEQTQGLSGVKPGDFSAQDGMLFFYLDDDMKYYWMPDTYFDLDLHYLDEKLKIVDIVRKLPHYIGRHNQDLIPRARGVWCRHVLEMKADSPLSQKLKIGDQLEWKGKYSLDETTGKIKEFLKQH